MGGANSKDKPPPKPDVVKPKAVEKKNDSSTSKPVVVRPKVVEKKADDPDDGRISAELIYTRPSSSLSSDGGNARNTRRSVSPPRLVQGGGDQERRSTGYTRRRKGNLRIFDDTEQLIPDEPSGEGISASGGAVGGRSTVPDRHAGGGVVGGLTVPPWAAKRPAKHRVIVRDDSEGNIPAISRKFEKTIIQNPKDKALLCAAIDFGTTYTGYMYSFKDKPDKPMTNYWDGGNIKTPTVVLMTPRKKFFAFGTVAKEKYRQLIKDGTHKDWYYFQHFKMKLFVKTGPLDKDMLLEDITDKKLPAIDVFTEAIRYMREHFLKVLNERESHVKITKDTDIHWVLTVPAIWDDLSKVFMREAATKAGIPDHMLTLALEPEAASLFCKKTLQLKFGCRYLVLDLGGGTADITCHEVTADGTLKELHQATGGAFGGTTVDHKFMSVLAGIFGADVIKVFKTEYMAEYWELMADFELKKRKFDGSDKIVMKFPVRLCEIYEDEIGLSVEYTLSENSSYSKKIEFKQGKVFMDIKLCQELFDEAVKKIVEAAKEVEDIVDGIEHIVLVGGFSESKYVTKVMMEHFENLVLTPAEPAGAVLNGAVIYGHETTAISSRVCKFTYGIARMMKFKEGQPEKKKIKLKGVCYCEDLFNKHIEIGQEVSVDTAAQVEAQKYYPVVEDQTQAVLEVYASTRKNPRYIDDQGCQMVGFIRIDINPKGDIWWPIGVKLIFGGTELIVESEELKTGNITRGAVQFFG